MLKVPNSTFYTTQHAAPTDTAAPGLQLSQCFLWYVMFVIVEFCELLAHVELCVHVCFLTLQHVCEKSVLVFLY